MPFIYRDQIHTRISNLLLSANISEYQNIYRSNFYFKILN